VTPSARPGTGETGARTAAKPGERPADRGEAINQAGEQRSARVESLRALAALAVVWGHVVAVSLALNPALPSATDLGPVERIAYGGGYGVFFFFALTGYLLFWPFAKRYFGGGDSIDLRRYAVNRALRILPLYYAVVVVVLLFQEHNPGLGVWARFLTFTETLSPGTAGRIVGPAWSLVVELCFYLLLPLLAYAVARLAGGSRMRAGAILIALGLASLAIRVVTIYDADPVDPLWRLNLPATFLFFVPGMLLALVRVSWEERRPAWLRGPRAQGDLWILATIPLWALVVLVSYSLDFLVGAAAFLIVGACVLPVRTGPVANALQWRPLAVVGIASYSLYLWHVPVIKALVDAGASTGFVALTAIAVPICLAVALASYAAIESPFLRLRRQWARSSAKQEAPPEPARAAA
jgi:peptidoglycan/LPS O-acetylase OafA/YrhL